jgi:cytoskeletal protein CcmA (bactofilin family)
MNLSFFLKPGLYVSKQTVIRGNVTADANVSVAGTIHGDIVTKATLIIEKNGLINGSAQAKNVIVKGKIKGNVQSDGKVDVIKKGEIDGHVYASEVNVDEEGLVKGVTKLITANTSNNHDSDAELSEDITPIITNKPATDEEKPQSWF